MEIQDNINKANEIGTTIWEEWKDATLATGAEKGAILMAEWKDQQFKEYLDKLEERCDKEYADVVKDGAEYNQGEAFGKLCLIVEIINELFGETENVDHSNNDE